MAITITNIEEYIAAGDIYVDAVVPAPLASVGDTLSPDGVPSGGVHVGATSGESVFRYEASIETVDIEQSTFPVAPFVTSESATLEFTVAEATAENIKRAIGQTFLRNVASGKLMSFGGLTAVTGTSVCIVAPKTDLPEMKRILAKYITAWNFVDKHGKPLPKPSAKSIGKLTPLLLIWCCVALVRACMEDVPFPKTLREGRSRS